MQIKIKIKTLNLKGALNNNDRANDKNSTLFKKSSVVSVHFIYAVKEFTRYTDIGVFIRHFVLH